MSILGGFLFQASHTRYLRIMVFVGGSSREFGTNALDVWNFGFRLGPGVALHSVGAPVFRRQLGLYVISLSAFGIQL
jgi:hypothetical protein